MENLNLKLSAPLAFIKIQTTGLDSKKDRIVELSIQKIGLDGKVLPGGRLINPGIDIPEEATKINGITNDMVKDKPLFVDIAVKLEKFLQGCDLAGFGIGCFDLKFLSEEFNRAGVEFTILKRKIIDLSNIYNAMEPRDLSAAYKFYCNKNNESLNNSSKITEMYFEILNSMTEKYNGKEISDKKGSQIKIESSIESFHSAFNKRKFLDIDGMIELNDNNVPIFAYGKCGPSKDKKTPGMSVVDALVKDKSYYDWIINLSTFSSDTILIIKKIMAKAEEKTNKAPSSVSQ